MRDGSSLYYSLLWTEQDRRQRFLARLSLVTSLSRTLEDVQEPTVAEQKIHWWHEELERLHAGNARHPATKGCQADLQHLDTAHAVCLELLSAVSNERFTPPATDADVAALVTKNVKARLALLSHALSAQESDLNTASHPDEAALGFALHEQLTRLPSLIHRGLPVFSSETYEKFGIKPSDLAKHIKVAPVHSENMYENNDQRALNDAPPTLKHIPIAIEAPGRAAMLEYVIETAQRCVTQAMSSETVRRRYRTPHLLPIWRLLVLRKYQLNLWQRRKPDLLRERLTMTPISKFYRAWRHRR